MILTPSREIWTPPSPASRLRRLMESLGAFASGHLKHNAAGHLVHNAAGHLAKTCGVSFPGCDYCAETPETVTVTFEGTTGGVTRDLTNLGPNADEVSGTTTSVDGTYDLTRFPAEQSAPEGCFWGLEIGDSGGFTNVTQGQPCTDWVYAFRPLDTGPGSWLIAYAAFYRYPGTTGLLPFNYEFAQVYAGTSPFLTDTIYQDCVTTSSDSSGGVTITITGHLPP